MKRKRNFKIAFSAALLVTCSFMYKVALADPAANCTYTGNSGDSCNASDGTHNLKVTNCRPGETACYYDAPTSS